MNVVLQLVLALGSWLLAALMVVARLRYEDRGVAEQRRRGISILPVWPLVPLLCLTPAVFLGWQHTIMKVMAGLHAALLMWSAGSIAYWTARTRQDA